MQFPQQPVLALCGESLSGINPLHIALFERYETPSYCSISPYYLSIYDEIPKNKENYLVNLIF